MQSKRNIEPLDTFEQDVPITPEQSEEQWRLKMGMRLSTPEYLAWCTELSNDPRPAHYDLNSDDDEPFTL